MTSPPNIPTETPKASPTKSAFRTDLRMPSLGAICLDLAEGQPAGQPGDQPGDQTDYQPEDQPDKHRGNRPMEQPDS